jgi:hypothetical protein
MGLWALSQRASYRRNYGLPPLKDFKAKVARRLAKEAAKAVNDEPGVMERLIMSEEKKKE